LIQPRAGAWVAESGGKVIGYLVGWVWIKRAWRPVKTAELENMFVLPDFRSQGAGKTLIKEFLTWCQAKKVKSVEVWAEFDNELGKKFYQDNGFVPARQMFELSLR
ncbi:MAG TPA: GNAT family N-acetyltransferase, partial [Patescibacteria group bacterium]|nr:GNAT family N-acetyltransferase [Patescibacteria group bacterium]